MRHTLFLPYPFQSNNGHSATHSIICNLQKASLKKAQKHYPVFCYYLNQLYGDLALHSSSRETSTQLEPIDWANFYLMNLPICRKVSGFNDILFLSLILDTIFRKGSYLEKEKCLYVQHSNWGNYRKEFECKECRLLGCYAVWLL
jgi:hypothetical protein